MPVFHNRFGFSVKFKHQVEFVQCWAKFLPRNVTISVGGDERDWQLYYRLMAEADELVQKKYFNRNWEIMYAYYLKINSY